MIIPTKGVEKTMASNVNENASSIGTLNEKPLHAALKSLLTKPGDRLEVKVDGYIVDILRDDLIIEIQTRNFSRIRKKLRSLLDQYPVRLVYPIAKEKWIIKADRAGERQKSRRKSPKKGAYEDLFAELVSFPDLVKMPNFSIEVHLIQEEELRIHDPKRAWRRRGWVTQERRLLKVIDRRRFSNPEDFAALLPASIKSQFTTKNLASTLQIRPRLAGQMAYCLREMGAIIAIGNRGRAILYTKN
jgi:hypothetical protein